MKCSSILFIVFIFSQSETHGTRVESIRWRVYLIRDTAVQLCRCCSVSHLLWRNGSWQKVCKQKQLFLFFFSFKYLLRWIFFFVFLFVGNEWESFSCECARVMDWKFNPSISLIVSLFRNFSRARFVFLFATSKLSVKRHVHPPKHFAKELLPISLRPNQTLIWVDLTQVKIVRWDKRRT